VKIPSIKKDWERVKFFREKYILVPDNQIRKRAISTAKSS
jgi:hypothetical protein